MQERDRYGLAIVAAEATCTLWELEGQQEGLDLDGMMRRLKDLSEYSLAHAEIMDQREGVEMLALAMYFGMTSNARFHRNRERLGLLSEETFAYQGRAEVVEQEIAQRKTGAPWQEKDNTASPLQPRLF
jgi:hypothetical protein